MKLISLLLAVLLLFSGCSQPEEASSAAQEETLPAVTEETAPPTTEPVDPLENLLQIMPLEYKVGQLFLARCPAGEATEAVEQYHLGGYVLFGRDFEGQTPETLSQTLAEYQLASAIPLVFAVDEEGGTVCRISGQPAFRQERFSSPRSLYESGGMEAVLEAEEEKAALLQSLDIHVNLAPVCDISIEPGAFLYSRSLGQDPETTGQFVAGAVEMMARYNVGSVLKHFPGYGNNSDTHTGTAVDTRSLEELERSDLVPFRMGIEAGCGAVMVSHTVVTALDDRLPASLSPAVHGYLRDTMEFSGVIVTDALDMGAVSQFCDPQEAAVQAVLAGNDLLICTEYAAQYEAVLEAVQSGRIPMETLDAAVMRVLRWKQSLNLMY